MEEARPCPFCEMDERVLESNEHANLFLSNPRKVEGHMLVTPKRHIELPWQITDEELVAVFGLVRVAQQALVAEFSGGVDIKQNYRPFMPPDGIKVEHLHYHVYPRTKEDELYQISERFEREMFTDLPEAEQARIEKLFKSEA